MNNLYAEVAQHLLAYRPEGLQRARVTYEWFDGVIKGPTISYLDASGQKLPYRVPDDTHRAISKLFRTHRDEELRREERRTGQLPNYFGMEVMPDGSHSHEWCFDPDAQAREDSRLRAQLGDAEYERLKQPMPRSKPEAERSRPRGDQPASQSGTAPEYSVSDLLGFLRQELVKNVPSNWHTIFVDGEVWEEGGQTNIRTQYFYTLPNDPDKHQFTSSNVVGPMNAVRELQRQIAHDGNVCRKVELQFTADDGSIQSSKQE